MTLRLYSYFRSSAAFRVRIALELKGIAYQTVPVNLLEGEQHGAAYRARNPQGLVPALELADGRLLTQSLAILEWLEAAHPQPALLPADAFERARIRALCALVACDIHPLNNLRVLSYLEQRLALDQATRDSWYHHWLGEGFAAIEAQLGEAPFVAGETPGMAEALLVPQVFNAHRFRFDMRPFPRLDALYQRCLVLEPFQRAHPQAQPDRV
jgi:maleylpyruvate isomerase